MPPVSWNHKVKRIEGSEQTDHSDGAAVHPFAYERGVDGVHWVTQRGGWGEPICVTKIREDGIVYLHAWVSPHHCSQIIYCEPEGSKELEESRMIELTIKCDRCDHTIVDKRQSPETSHDIEIGMRHGGAQIVAIKEKQLCGPCADLLTAILVSYTQGCGMKEVIRAFGSREVDGQMQIFKRADA